MTYAAHVGNIGFIGEFATLESAVKAVEQTIAKSASADGYGFVTDDFGDIVDVGSDTDANGGVGRGESIAKAGRERVKDYGAIIDDSARVSR